MKKYTIGLLSVFVLVGIAGVVSSAPVSAAATDHVAANINKINKCNKQADSLAKVSTDLEFFKATYYVLPSAEDIAAHYPSTVRKGSKLPVPTAIYKGTEPKTRVGKTNYALVAQRFTNTQTYFSSLVLKGTSTPALDQAGLSSLIAHNAAVNESIVNHVQAIDAVKAAFPVGIYDCSNSQQITAVATKYKAEQAAVKKLHQDIVIVRNKTQESRGDYQKLEAQRVKLVHQHKI